MTLMSRSLENQILAWEKSPIRSPLMLIGPRQVGKTTLLKSIAQKLGKNVFEINFWQDNKKILAEIFKNRRDPQQIVKDLADYFKVASINPNEDVLFIDEIQDCPEAYSSLKLFKEQMRELKILVTGSYLQLFLANETLTKLPVGCVDEFYLGPLSFSEFLQNSEKLLYDKFNALDINDFKVSTPLHQQLMDKFHEYCFVGGLPEIVYLYIQSQKNIELKNAIRKKQQDLLNQYTLDFQKFGKSVHIKKIDQLFHSVARQLDTSTEEPVSRFQFNQLGNNAKYSHFHWSFAFLENTGLILRSFIISKIDQPFRVHEKSEDRNLFKCFLFDLGILGACLNTPQDFNLSHLGSYKGYIAENFVAIQLNSKKPRSLVTFKKSSRKDSAEVEFILSSTSGEAVPIEVKSSAKSLKSKSLDSYMSTYAPSRAFKIVPVVSDTPEKSGYTQLPLYMIEKIAAFIE